MLRVDTRKGRSHADRSPIGFEDEHPLSAQPGVGRENLINACSDFNGNITWRWPATGLGEVMVDGNLYLGIKI
jgi:hypothetical protein